MGVNVSRRSFFAGASAFGLCPAMAVADERPYLKFGVMTDTHVQEREWTASRVRGAFKVFKQQGVDVIGHCGDLADWHVDEAYRLYRAALEAAYPDKATRPELLYVYAGHDALNPKAKDPNDHATRMYDEKTAYGWMREKLAIDHWLYCEKTIKGVDFIVTPQNWRLVDGGAKFIDERLGAACAANPGKPVVFMTHFPPAGTVYSSSTWGNSNVTDVLSRHPQVVAFTGHSHGSLRNELKIWQGAFTEVDVCCLQQWEGSCVGQYPRSKQAYGVLVVEFYRDRLVLRRFDVRDGSEYKADDPWVVALPFDAKTAPLAYDVRKRAERPVSFAAGSAIDVTTGKPPFDRVKVAFRAASDEDRVFKYRIRLARRRGGAWEDFAMAELYSEFYLRPSDRKGAFSFDFSSMYFPEGEEVRIRVVPVGFFETEGPAIERVWAANGGVKAVSSWTCENPMEEMPVVYHWWPRNAREYNDAKPYAPKDGWYDCHGAYYWMTLPENLFDVPKGTRFRVAVELRMKQDPVNDGVTLCVSGGRSMMTVPGDAGLVRYVSEFTTGEKRVPRRVVLSRSEGRARFERIVVERM